MDWVEHSCFNWYFIGEFMKNKLKFLMICVILSLISISVVFAADDNSTIMGNGSATDSESVKEVPTISINTSEVFTGKSVDILLKDSNENPISNQTLLADIDENNYSLFTDNKGAVNLDLNLKPGSYVLNVIFKGNDVFSAVNQTFDINILKLSCKITPGNTTLFWNDYFYVNLKDNFGNPIINSNVKFTANGGTYSAKTDSAGNAGLRITLNPNKSYLVQVDFAGNEYYNPVSKNVTLIVPARTTLVIGNDRLLTNGYLRVYLKSSTLSAISKQTVLIKIGQKTFVKTTNSEGVIIFKPGLGVGNYTVTAEFNGTSSIAGCWDIKDVVGVNESVRNPLKEKIPLKNGIPDIDVMPGNYVMADGDMKYTLLKNQYKEVLKRDSYCLYLKNKMSKYVFFKTKSEPKLQHVLVREKWNVIERELNTKIVKKNKNNYWPSKITVSLRGKSYTYAAVRDIQNTGYTCGPTSCSMCSQVLKNYICEKQLAKLAKSNAYDGSSTRNLKKALEKCNFKCSIYYKSSFNKAINQLKKGGCALVFHTWNHYISILDISKDGNRVLIGNPSGDYDIGSHGIPTKWVTVKFIKGKFNNYDTSGLIVKLKYSLSKSVKEKMNNIYSSMGSSWVAKNTDERIPNVGL